MCPFNCKRARDATEPRFQPRAATWDKDAATLAREKVAMSEDRFRTALKSSPVKRAMVEGLRRNAAVLLEGTASAVSS